MVLGEAYDFVVPFTGYASIFQMQPNSYDTKPPMAVVTGYEPKFTVAGRTLAQEALQQQVNSLLGIN